MYGCMHRPFTSRPNKFLLWYSGAFPEHGVSISTKTFGKCSLHVVDNISPQQVLICLHALNLRCDAQFSYQKTSGKHSNECLRRNKSSKMVPAVCTIAWRPSIWRKHPFYSTHEVKSILWRSTAGRDWNHLKVAAKYCFICFRETCPNHNKMPAIFSSSLIQLAVTGSILKCLLEIAEAQRTKKNQISDVHMIHVARMSWPSYA